MICPVCETSFTWAGWQQLVLLGPVDSDFYDRDDVLVEQRNCTCGTTLTATVECRMCANLDTDIVCSPGCECFCHTA
jgi:hypothetical protein